MTRQMYFFKPFLGLIVLLFCIAPFIYGQSEKELLEMTLEELMNVRITTAARTPEKIGDIPASVVLITRKDIETFGYQTLEEVIENIPGLYAINDYSEEGVSFGVRGFWSGVANDNMIVLVNDVPQVDDFHSNYPLPKISIPIEAIDRIEIIRGPMSVIYGNGAFYGVINIFTDNYQKNKNEDNDTTENETSISTSYGSNKTGKIFLRTSGKNGGFNYVLNASLHDSYGPDHAFSSMVRNPSDLINFGVPIDHRTGGRLEKDEKYFGFHGDFNHFFLDISYVGSQNEILFFFPSPNEGSQNQINKTSISFGYKNKISKLVSINGKFTYNISRLWEDYDFLFNNFYGIQQLESDAWELDLNLFLTVSSKLDIKSGVYYRSILNVSNMYDLPSFGSTSFENNYFHLSDGENIDTRAIYTQINFALSSRFRLIGGIRLEQMPKYSLEAELAGGTESFNHVANTYDQDEIEIIPRFAAIYSINDRHFFKLLYGQAINRPSFFQNTQNLLLEPSKGPLEPESIKTLEFNYIASFSSNFSLNTSVFRNTLDHLITRVSRRDDEGNYETWSANAGEMVTTGVELTLNYEPFNNFRLEMSTTFQETEDKRPDFEGIDVAYSPKALGYLKASYHSGGFSLALTGNYVGAMESFWDDTMENPDGSTGARIGDRVPSYFVLGANLRIDNLFLKGLYFNLRCSNLLDEEIRYPTYTNNTWADRGTLGIGRTFLATLGIKF